MCKVCEVPLNIYLLTQCLHLNGSLLDVAIHLQDMVWGKGGRQRRFGVARVNKICEISQWPETAWNFEDKGNENSNSTEFIRARFK